MVKNLEQKYISTVKRLKVCNSRTFSVFLLIEVNFRFTAITLKIRQFYLTFVIHYTISSHRFCLKPAKRSQWTNLIAALIERFQKH